MVRALTSKFRRGRAGSRSRHSSRRQIERPILALLIVLAVALSGAVALYLSRIAGADADEPAPVAAQAETDHRIGAIMYVPVKGPMCEVHTFDNVTGQVVPNGFVNCERKATEEAAETMGQNTERAARLRAITGAFKK